MAKLSLIARWIPETDGERLFLAIYHFVTPNVPPLFGGKSWIASPDGMTELSRLIASIEVTHRCLNLAVELYEVNPHASVDALVHRLRLKLGLHQMGDATIKVAQTARLAALAYINRRLTKTQIADTHRSGSKTCCWCGIATQRKNGTPRNCKATVEHLWPEYLGGTSTPENLTIACEECNTKRQHAFSWAWFATQAVNEKLDKNGSLPRELLLSLGLHRLIKVASGQSIFSAKRISLKDAAMALKGAIPQVNLEAGIRYTFFEILENAME